jgi:hypothetical protein
VTSGLSRRYIICLVAYFPYFEKKKIKGDYEITLLSVFPLNLFVFYAVLVVLKDSKQLVLRKEVFVA